MKPLLEYEFSNINSYKLVDLKKVKEHEFVPAVNNPMFLTIINNEAKKKYAAFIISEVLKEDYNYIYTNMILLNNKIDQSKVKNAITMTDFICSVNNEIIIIEMNGQIDKSRLLRNLEYLCKTFSNIRLRGDKYNYKKVRLIDLNNFSIIGNKTPVTKYGLSDLIEREKNLLTDYIYIYHVELPRIREKFQRNEKLNMLEKFMLAMNEEDSKRLEEEIGGIEIMEEYRKDAKEAVTEEFLTQAEIDAIEDRYAYNVGIEQNKTDVVKKMLKKNYDTNTISDITGMGKKEIKNIMCTM